MSWLPATLLLMFMSGACGQLSRADVNELLDAHNEVRRTVIPTATNIERMEWNEELAERAQEETDGCTYAITPTGALVFIEMIMDGGFVSYADLVLQYWTRLPLFHQQLVWATANNVGCGASQCSGLYVVCLYNQAPESDMEPYIPGPSCTLCPPDKPDCDLDLCASNTGMSAGADPHFSVVLPTGDMLCYSIQGRKDMVFNLITNSKVVINALFIDNSNRPRATWMGQIGIFIRDRGSTLKFDGVSRTVTLLEKVAWKANDIKAITLKNNDFLITENEEQLDETRQTSVNVRLMDVGIDLTIKFNRGHLDLFWHSTTFDEDLQSHGLIGQFFQAGVVIDKVRKILIMPNKEPVPVMPRPVWAFMERESKDDKLCWTAMNPGYQGKKLIDFTYMDYRVDDMYSDSFVNQFQVLTNQTL